MRSKFPGYYKPTEEEFKDLWENGLFVLDTNVLLDLFRYSQETVDALIDAIINLKSRVWIPYRVSLEYHRNLNEVITCQIKSYQKTIETLEIFKSQLESKRGHPFLNNELQREIQEFCTKFGSELSDKKHEIECLITENPIKEKISTLLDDKVGNELDREKIEQIHIDGAKRYQAKTPPGYMDIKEKQGIDIYGDLIIWNEIIEKSKESNSHIILVTGDVKEDWFLKHSGKTIGPRPELIHEFRNETGKMFYAYTTNQFLEFLNSYFESNIDKQIIEEVKQIITIDQNNNSLSNTNTIKHANENPMISSFTNSTIEPNSSTTISDINSGQTEQKNNT